MIGHSDSSAQERNIVAAVEEEINHPSPGCHVEFLHLRVSTSHCDRNVRIAYKNRLSSYDELNFITSRNRCQSWSFPHFLSPHAWSFFSLRLLINPYHWELNNLQVGRWNLALLENICEPLESFIQNNEEFIPSHEWQMVKEGNFVRNSLAVELQALLVVFEGQAVPPGLHIRLNLQTGVREAKLLEDAPSKKEEHGLIAIEQQPNETKSRENLQRAFAKLDLSADDVQTSDVRMIIPKRSSCSNVFFSLGARWRSASKVSFVRGIEERLRFDANEDWNRSRDRD